MAYQFYIYQRWAYYVDYYLKNSIKSIKFDLFSGNKHVKKDLYNHVFQANHKI